MRHKLIAIIITIIVIFLTLYRFQFRIPTDLYIKATYEQGLLFLLMLLVNVIGCIVIGLAIMGNSNPNSIMQEISQFMEHNLKIGNKLLFNAISTKMPYYQYILAYTTKYYLKLSHKVLYSIEHLPRLFILIIFIVDVFYFERLYYVYLSIFIYILTLLSKFIRFAAIAHNMYLLEFMPTLIESTLLPDGNIKITLINDKEGVESLEQYHSVNYFIDQELRELNHLNTYLSTSLYHLIARRLSYLFIWFYIVYHYPLHIVLQLCSQIYVMFYFIPLNLHLVIFILLFYIIFNKWFPKK